MRRKNLMRLAIASRVRLTHKLITISYGRKTNSLTQCDQNIPPEHQLNCPRSKLFVAIRMLRLANAFTIGSQRIVLLLQ